MLAEGKTKIVEDAGNSEVFVRSKDNITAGDGAKHDVLHGKAAASTRTTSNVYRLLERNGIPTHFVDRVDDVAFRACGVKMIPLELVARRYSPAAAEAIGPNVHAGDLISEEPLGESRYADVPPELIASLRSLTVSAFGVIENAWKQQGGVYLDFKIECGFDRETGELLVADVIDTDSGRLRFGEVDMSKQSYRDGSATLPEIKKKFDQVAAHTDRFV